MEFQPTLAGAVKSSGFLFFYGENPVHAPSVLAGKNEAALELAFFGVCQAQGDVVQAVRTVLVFTPRDERTYADWVLQA